jgi:hypothetical protein
LQIQKALHEKMLGKSASIASSVALHAENPTGKQQKEEKQEAGEARQQEQEVRTQEQEVRRRAEHASEVCAFIAHGGFMPAGNDLYNAQGITLAEAKQWTAANPTCLGFTFAGPAGEPPAHVKLSVVHFKSKGEWQAAEGWHSYVVHRPLVTVAVVPAATPATPANAECVPGAVTKAKVGRSVPGDETRHAAVARLMASRKDALSLRGCDGASSSRGEHRGDGVGNRKWKRWHWTGTGVGNLGSSAAVWPQSEGGREVITDDGQLQELRALFSQGGKVANAAVLHESDTHTGRRKIKHFTMAAYMGCETRDERAETELVMPI